MYKPGTAAENLDLSLSETFTGSLLKETKVVRWPDPLSRDRASDSQPVLAAPAREPAVPSQSSAPTLRLGGGLFGGK